MKLLEKPLQGPRTPNERKIAKEMKDTQKEIIQKEDTLRGKSQIQG